MALYSNFDRGTRTLPEIREHLQEASSVAGQAKIDLRESLNGLNRFKVRPSIIVAAVGQCQTASKSEIYSVSQSATECC